MGVQKRCAPTSIHAPPPAWLCPASLAHTPPFPVPGGIPDPSASFLHPHSDRLQHPLPRLRRTMQAHPSRLHCSLLGLHCPSFHAPSLRARSPCVWPSSCVHPHPSCASGMH